MQRLAALAPLALALFAAAATAQPTNAPDQAERALSPYVYLVDGKGNRILVSTQFWRNDQKYDDRAFHRFLDVLAALEKRGFKKSDKVTIEGWDKPQPYSRCFIYLEDLQSGRVTKTTVTSGARVWCTATGISEIAIQPSDNAKHVAQVMDKFEMMFDKSQKSIGK